MIRHPERIAHTLMALSFAALVAIAFASIIIVCVSSSGDCPGNHVCEGPCVETQHLVSIIDDGRCYDTRARLIPSADGKSYSCRCEVSK